MPQCSVKGMGSGREEIDKEEEEDEVPEEEEDEVADGHNQGFPKDEEIKKRWIHMCSRQDPINAKNALICSLHFKESDFERNLKYELLKKPVPKRLVQLKKGSVPTLHLPQTQVQPVSCSREVRAVRRGQKRLVEEILRRVLEETEEEIAKEKPANKGTHFLGKKELQRELENISKKREAEKTSRMAISSISVVKRRKRVKKSESLDSDEDQPESEEEKYVIENNVQDDDFDSFNLEGASFTPYPNDSYFVEIIEGDFDEVYIKEEKVEDWESEGSANEYKIKETKQKRTKKVKFSEPEASSNGLDDRHKNFLEGEKDEDSCGDDESEKEEGIYKQSVGSGLANVMAKIQATKKSEDVTVSTAKTDKEVKKTVRVRKENTFEIVDSSGQIKKEPMVEHIKEEEEDKELDISLHDREMHRKLWEEKFHKRPGITEDKMKVDVVQQFSAIEKHQNMIEVKLPQCRSTIGWEKLLEGTGREAFLDILKQQGKRVKETIPMLKKVKKEENRKSVEVKEEPVDLYPPE